MAPAALRFVLRDILAQREATSGPMIEFTINSIFYG
jgi:hypothetical protein